MKKILTFITIILSTVSFSQNVTVSIENLKANYVTVPNGSSIDMGTDSSVNVTFRVDLEKLETYTIGPAKVWISVFNSSGNRTDHSIVPVPANEFIASASASFAFDIFDSEINFGNGNYLSAVLKQDNQPGAEWESQHIPIIKTPAFALSPSSLSLPCGDTNSRTFTVTNSSNLSGVTYQWNIGGGWLRNGNAVSNFTTTTPSVTLTPSVFPPSNVNVTPVLNGVNYSTLTSTVSLSGFSPANTIFGENAFCNISSTTYSVNNLPNGSIISSWTSSNPNIITINPTNNHQAVATKTGNGAAIITAVIENSCGQQKPITKEIWTGGKPQFTFELVSIGINYLNINMVGTNGTNIHNQGITSTTWEKVSGSGGCFSSFFGSMFSASGNGNCNNWVVHAKITATNSCGTTTVYASFTPPAPDPCDDNFRFVQNPIKSGNNVNSIIIDPCEGINRNSGINKSESYEINIYNFHGENVYSKIQSGIDFDISSLKKGFYIVRFQTKSRNVISKKLIIE